MADPDDTDLAGIDWQRVARAVRDRRLELGLTQQRLAELARVSPMTLRQLEHANQTSYRRSTLVAVSVNLRWGTDGLMRIGRGEDPADVATDADVVVDAAAVADVLRQIREEFGGIVDRLERIESELKNRRADE